MDYFHQISRWRLPCGPPALDGCRRGIAVRGLVVRPVLTHRALDTLPSSTLTIFTLAMRRYSIRGRILRTLRTRYSLLHQSRAPLQWPPPRRAPTGNPASCLAAQSVAALYDHKHAHHPPSALIVCLGSRAAMEATLPLKRYTHHPSGLVGVVPSWARLASLLNGYSGLDGLGYLLGVRPTQDGPVPHIGVL